MALYDFSISGIRGPVNSDGLGWATVSIQLELAEPDSYPEIEIDVPIKFDQSQTLSQVRTIVLDRAIKLLQEAQAEITSKGLRGLDQFAAEKIKEADEAGALLDEAAA